MVAWRMWRIQLFDPGEAKDVTALRIWQRRGFSSSEDLAGLRICQQPGFGHLNVLAASRIWRSREFVSLEDMSASRLWGRRGRGRAGDEREFKVEIVINSSFCLFFLYVFVCLCDLF